MKLLLNLIWLLFGGLWSAIGCFTGGVALCLTIIGIPFGLQAFKIGLVVLWPFGTQIVDSESGSGCLSLILNLIWFVFGGLWVAIIHLVFGVLLCITVIGIPFGLQHFKLIPLVLMPFGKKVISEIG